MTHFAASPRSGCAGLTLSRFVAVVVISLAAAGACGRQPLGHGRGDDGAAANDGEGAGTGGAPGTGVQRGGSGGSGGRGASATGGAGASAGGSTSGTGGRSSGAGGSRAGGSTPNPGGSGGGAGGRGTGGVATASGGRPAEASVASCPAAPPGGPCPVDGQSCLYPQSTCVCETGRWSCVDGPTAQPLPGTTCTGGGSDGSSDGNSDGDGFSGGNPPLNCLYGSTVCSCPGGADAMWSCGVCPTAAPLDRHTVRELAVRVHLSQRQLRLWDVRLAVRPTGLSRLGERALRLPGSRRHDLLVPERGTGMPLPTVVELQLPRRRPARGRRMPRHPRLRLRRDHMHLQPGARLALHGRLPRRRPGTGLRLLVAAQLHLRGRVVLLRRHPLELLVGGLGRILDGEPLGFIDTDRPIGIKGGAS